MTLCTIILMTVKKQEKGNTMPPLLPSFSFSQSTLILNIHYTIIQHYTTQTKKKQTTNYFFFPFLLFDVEIFCCSSSIKSESLRNASLQAMTSSRLRVCFVAVLSIAGTLLAIAKFGFYQVERGKGKKEKN